VRRHKKSIGNKLNNRREEFIPIRFLYCQCIVLYLTTHCCKPAEENFAVIIMQILFIQQPPVVIDLPEMIIKVPIKMNKEIFSCHF